MDDPFEEFMVQSVPAQVRPHCWCPFLHRTAEALRALGQMPRIDHSMRTALANRVTIVILGLTGG